MNQRTKKAIRTAIAVSVLVATVIVFAVYIRSHPEIIQALRDVSPAIIAGLFLLYTVFMATLIWIQRATLELCGIVLGRKESTLLVLYSSIINFFGPLQSGPAFRAAYLKAKHNVSLKKYTGATLLYYLFYGVFSLVLIGAYLVGWMVVAACLLVMLLIPFILKTERFRTLEAGKIWNLAFASLAQVAVMTVIYYVEIKTFFPDVSYLQSLVYTGAANLALFVSLTPGAIGFRESFLFFSQSLHGVSNAVIAAASIVDRAVYISLLIICAIVIFGLHANDYLRIKQDKKAGSKTTP